MVQFRVFAAVAITGMVVMPVAAQGRSGDHAGATSTHGKPATGSGSTTTTTHGKSGDTSHGGAATTHGKDDSDHERPSSSSKTKSSTTTTSTPSTGPTALSTKISRNPNQLARITAMLPAGMTLEQATTGFRNQGQFIAALNASKNQGVSFVDLQKAMTVDGLSLGQAVRKLQSPPAPTTTTGTTSGSTTGAS